MPRAIAKLSALAVTRAKKAGLYGDGGGLYLQVSDGGAKSWLLRFMLNGRARAMGLGSLQLVSLAEARVAAIEGRKLLLRGADPIEARKERRGAARLEAAKAMTFKECATAFIDAHKAGWRNAKHQDQWRNTLATYVDPVFGALPVQGVDVALVMKVLEPIWSVKPETAGRVRMRIERVLDWATTRGYRTGENPARWRGHLSNLLPARSKVRKVKHHPALDHREIAGFTSQVRKQEGLAARALEFTILTAARTSETLQAKWSEVDGAEKVWRVPAARMKSGEEHAVPLSAAALRVLNEVHDMRAEGGYIFPGAKRGKPLSNMAMLALRDRMGRSDITVHGFRSTFRDWCEERTRYPHPVKEAALAHKIPDKVEAAYRRGDLIEKRRRLMEDWARYCCNSTVTAKVVPIRKTAG